MWEILLVKELHRILPHMHVGMRAHAHTRTHAHMLGNVILVICDVLIASTISGLACDPA
jgi:hypothetical protein